MEIREFWDFDEFPEFAETLDGVETIETTGNEMGARYIPNIEYANVDGLDLHLQILLPYCRNELVYNRRISRPCVVFVQGSAWMNQDVYGQLPQVARLADMGYEVAIVEYRHSGIAAFPAQAVDTRNAIRFLRIHAEEYGIDSEKIVVAGDSSGGHTAVLAGMLHDDDTKNNMFPGVSAEVKGIVNFYGSVSVMLEDANPTTINHCLPDSPEGMVMGGVNLRENPELRKKLSLEENITEATDIAPMLIFHGTKDRIVNTKQSVLLYKKLKECGKDVQFYLIKGADHSGPEFWTPQVLDIVDKFIRNCLNL